MSSWSARADLTIAGNDFYAWADGRGWTPVCAGNAASEIGGRERAPRGGPSRADRAGKEPGGRAGAGESAGGISSPVRWRFSLLVARGSLG